MIGEPGVQGELTSQTWDVAHESLLKCLQEMQTQREDQTTVQQTRDIVLHDAFLSNVFPTCANYLRILGRSSKKVAISPFLMELQAFIGMPKEDCWVDAQLPNLQVNTVNQ